MNDFHGTDGADGPGGPDRHRGPNGDYDGYDGSRPAEPGPPEGYPAPPAGPYGPVPPAAPPGYAYGSTPPGTGGWGEPAPTEGYWQGGAAPGGPAQDGYPRHGYPQGGLPAGGDPQGGYPQQPEAPGYAPPAPSYGHGQEPHGYTYAEGAAYVPEPLTGQYPSEAEPGAGYGMPAAGGAWGGQPPAGQEYGTPPAADAWSAAPAPAPAWDTAPGHTSDYGQPAAVPDHTGHRRPAPDYGPPATAPGHAPDQGRSGAVPRHAGPPAGVPGGGTDHGRAAYAPAAEREVEKTAALSVVDLEAALGAPRRSGSPIIPPGIQPAALTAALGLLIAGGAAVGRPGLAVVLVALQAVTAAGWFRLNGMWPARQGIVLAFLSGVTADIAILAVSGGHGPVALLGTLGVWLLLVLVLQLRHHGSADERLSSLTATSASTLLTVVAAGYLVTATSHAGTDPVVVGAIAVAAATLARAVRLPGGEPVSLVASLAVAAVTGALTGPATGFGTGHAVLLAVAAGICALIGLRVASYDWPSRFVHFTAGVALPLTAAAPVVYALGVALS